MIRKFDAPSLLVATHNAGKLEEIADLLSEYPITVMSAAEHELDEPEETGTTFVENARIKARAAVAATGLPALADDSGLSVDGLDGAPGVYTADWAETSEGRDFDLAMQRVFDALTSKSAPTPWAAQFRCTFVLAWPDGHEEVFEGSSAGHLVWPPRGDQGHGYDPMFVPAGHDVTFGEMDRWKKNRMSHRADAFAKLAQAFAR